MTWWVLTYLENTRAYTSLKVLSQTNRADHLFMSWAKYQPSRKRIYRTVRGTTIWCGYQYIWDTPNIVEQNEPTDTADHTFGLIPLAPTDHVWYYLWAIAGPYGHPCQGPLIHVLPPEIPMPSARVFHSIAQTIPQWATTTLTFDSQAWDDGGFHSPTNPTRLTAPFRGLYSVGCCFRFATTVPAGASGRIVLNGGPPIVYHSHYINGNNWPGAGFSFNTIIPLEVADFLEVEVYHSAGAFRDINADPNYGPHFWIAYLGPNPT